MASTPSSHHVNNPIFFNDLFDILDKSEMDNNIIAGDWKFYLNQDLDTFGYSHKNNPIATDVVYHQVIKRNLVDVWRLKTPTNRKYTWKKRTL